MSESENIKNEEIFTKSQEILIISSYEDSSINKNLTSKISQTKDNSELEENEESNLNQKENSNENLDLNKIIENKGYCLRTLNILFQCTLSIMLLGMMQLHLPTIASAFQNYYKISEGFLGFVISLYRVGEIVGRLLTGYLLKLLDRKNIIIICLIGVTITNLMISVIPNLYVFIVFKFLSGVLLSPQNTIIYTIMAEYLPMKFRGFVLTFIWSSWNVGTIYFLLFLKIYCPILNYYPEKALDKNFPQDFNMAYFSILYLEILLFISAIFFLKDSPRNLLLHKKNEEAGEILEYYMDRKLTSEELEIIGDKIIKKGENKYANDSNSMSANYQLMFSKRYLKLLIFLVLSYFLLGLSLGGMNVAIPILLKKPADKESINEKQDIDKLIIYNILNFSLIPAILVEIKSISKKNYQLLLLSINIVLVTFALFIKNENICQYLIFFGTALLHYAYDILITWSVEILPTKIRDSAYGLMQALSSFGSFVANFIYLIMAKHDRNLTIIFYLLSSILTVILVFFNTGKEVNDFDESLNLSSCDNSIERSNSDLINEENENEIVDNYIEKKEN